MFSYAWRIGSTKCSFIKFYNVVELGMDQWGVWLFLFRTRVRLEISFRRF